MAHKTFYVGKEAESECSPQLNKLSDGCIEEGHLYGAVSDPTEIARVFADYNFIRGVEGVLKERIYQINCGRLLGYARAVSIVPKSSCGTIDKTVLNVLMGGGSLQRASRFINDAKRQSNAVFPRRNSYTGIYGDK